MPPPPPSRFQSSSWKVAWPSTASRAAQMRSCRSRTQASASLRNVSILLMEASYHTSGSGLGLFRLRRGGLVAVVLGQALLEVPDPGSQGLAELRQPGRSEEQ